MESTNEVRCGENGESAFPPCLDLRAAGGSVGALLGMHLFHHKTRKKKFTIGVPLMLAAQILLFFFLAKAGLLFFA